MREEGEKGEIDITESGARVGDATGPDDATRADDASGPDDAAGPDDATGADDASGAGNATGPDDGTRAGDTAGASRTVAGDDGPEVDSGAAAGGDGEAATRPAHSVASFRRAPYRRTGFAVARALAVLIVAAVGYQLVVPTDHVERGRLARLVPTKPGLTAFDKASPQAGEQDDTKTGLAAMTAAAKRSPGHTGIYSVQWVPTQTSGVGIVTFLLPNAAAAVTTFTELRTQQLGTGSFSSSGLRRTATFTVAAVPGSSGAEYAPSPKAKAAVPGLAVTVFRYGKVVALIDASTSNSTDKAAVDAVTASEYGNLHRLGTGFTLSVTRRPGVATGLWVAGAIVVAAVAALWPVARRRRAEKRQRAYDEMMANRVTVGRRVIVKHRR